MAVFNNVILVPTGKVEMEVLEHLRAGLGAIFECPVGVEMPEPSPSYAYDAGRKQHRSAMIIERLGSAVPSRSAGLGVAGVDLYAPGLTFVFGEAEVSGKAAVISLSRLRPSFYGLPPDSAVTGSRALKEAVHELGHVAGLHHCQSPGCVMTFSRDISASDEKGWRFCRSCLETIQPDR